MLLHRVKLLRSSWLCLASGSCSVLSRTSRGGLCSSAWGDLHLGESWAQTGEQHIHGESRIILKPLFQLISLFMQTQRQWCSETLQPVQHQCSTPQGTETAGAREGRDHLHPCTVPWAVLLAATRAECSEPSCVSNKRRRSNQSSRGQPLWQQAGA